MKKTGREPQVPGRAGGGGRAGVLLLWAAVGLGAGFINGLLGAFLLERTSPRRLRRLFAAVILVSGIRMLF